MDPEVIYWIARCGLVLVWFLATIVAIRGWRGGSSAGWGLLALLAGTLGVLRATRLDWRVFGWAQEQLRDAGVYDTLADPVEWAILGVILVGVVVGVRALHKRLAPQGGAPLLPLALAGAMIAFVLIECFSVDDLIPEMLRAQPGRYILEYVLALGTLFTARR